MVFCNNFCKFFLKIFKFRFSNHFPFFPTISAPNPGMLQHTSPPLAAAIQGVITLDDGQKIEGLGADQLKLLRDMLQDGRDKQPSPKDFFSLEMSNAERVDVEGRWGMACEMAKNYVGRKWVKRGEIVGITINNFVFRFIIFE